MQTASAHQPDLIPAASPVQLITVEHPNPAYSPVPLTAPINWAMNPYNSPAWLHHFMSLRWIRENVDSEQLFEILKSFYRFHCVKETSNAYYTKLRGDHAAVLRLKQLFLFREKFSTQRKIPALGICERLIRADIKNLQSPEMYRAGHNHGLMVDIVLLRTWENYPDFRASINVELVIDRGSATLDEMFNEDGVTREHSISYQEHNYPLAVEFLNLHPSRSDPKIADQMRRITESTKRILSLALRDSGDYFAIGDTLRVPNTTIRKRHPEVVESESEWIASGSMQSQLFSNAGFFLYKRMSVSSASALDNVHFSATCGWNSINHKQDDELSFCLDVNGKLIFDDPGYTVSETDRDMNLRKASSHSTIEIQDHRFESIANHPYGSEITNWHETRTGFVLNMQHRRIKGHIISREFLLNENCLRLRDRVLLDDRRANIIAHHNFVLGPTIEARPSRDSMDLYENNELIARLQPIDGNGKWNFHKIDYVGLNKYEYISTTKISFVSQQEICDFRIDF